MEKITILLLLVINTLCFGQSITWQKAYKGIYPTDYFGNDICKADNGNFYLIATCDYPRGAYIVKINPYGDTIWTRFYQQGESYAGTSSADGGCIITGFWHTGPISSFALRINSSGETVWHKNYTESPGAICYRIIRTSDNKFVACGRISYGTAYYGYIMKLDSNGNMIWQKHYPSIDVKIYKTLIETNDKCYITGGVFSDNPYQTGKGILTKVDTSGNIIWDKIYNSYQYSIWNVASINSINNELLITGDTYDSNTVNYGFRFNRLDENGNVIFSKFYPQTNNHKYNVNDSKVINNNKYLICYSRYNFPIDTMLANAIITDSTGNIIKHKEIAGIDYTIFYRSQLIDNGDIIFIGNSNHIYSYLENIFSARVDSNLNVQTIGINNSNTTMPENFKLYQNYPNPFNQSTMFKFQCSISGNVEIKVFDISAKEVAKPVDRYLQAGTYQVRFNAGDLPSGIYFYRLESGDFVQVKRMILIK